MDVTIVGGDYDYKALRVSAAASNCQAPGCQTSHQCDFLDDDRWYRP
ncbi:MAG: hypothetical protein MJ184_09360 [Treponema sp.]|nr:hypothetical protein [Treponema sp.]MCQ2601552.1 hypothetical protein [Treponema sp.]